MTHKFLILLGFMFLISCKNKETSETTLKKDEKKAIRISKNIDKKELFKVKLFHPETEIEFDSIVSKDFLEEDLFMLLEFNYPKFELKFN